MRKQQLDCKKIKSKFSKGNTHNTQKHTDTYIGTLSPPPHIDAKIQAHMHAIGIPLTF